MNEAGTSPEQGEAQPPMPLKNILAITAGIFPHNLDTTGQDEILQDLQGRMAATLKPLIQTFEGIPLENHMALLNIQAGLYSGDPETTMKTLANREYWNTLAQYNGGLFPSQP